MKIITMKPLHSNGASDNDQIGSSASQSSDASHVPPFTRKGRQRDPGASVGQAKALAQVRGVLGQSRSKGSARLVLTILATHTGKTQDAWPSVPRLAYLANISERQVQFNLRELMDLKELEIACPGGGRHRTTTYRITLKPFSPNQLSETVKSMKGVLQEKRRLRSPE